MTENWAARLRVRLTKRINSDDPELQLTFKGRSLRLVSENVTDPLKDTDWVIFSAGGFEDESSALAFGTALKSAVALTGFIRTYGVDFGDDLPSGWVNAAALAEVYPLPAGCRYEQNVHGLMVLGDAANARFFTMRASITVSDSTEQISRCLCVLTDFSAAISDGASRMVGLLNSALAAQNSLAKFLLSIAAVETVAEEGEWSNPQKAAREKILDLIRSEGTLSEDEKAELVDSIAGSRRISVGMSIRRLLGSLGLADQYPRWRSIYVKRSGLLHGSGNLTVREVNALSNDAYGFANKVCLRLLEQDGLSLPNDLLEGIPT